MTPQQIDALKMALEAFQIDALKMALEAFGEIAWSNETQWQRDRAKKAITAIKEALAKPEQDTVVFLKEWSDWRNMVVQNLMRHGGIDKDFARRLAHFYQDSAPQRTWVGLTDEERSDIYNQKDWNINYGWEYEQAIEAKLKQKNGYTKENT